MHQVCNSRMYSLKDIHLWTWLCSCPSLKLRTLDSEDRLLTQEESLPLSHDAMAGSESLIKLNFTYLCHYFVCQI